MRKTLWKNMRKHRETYADKHVEKHADKHVETQVEKHVGKLEKTCGKHI